MYEKFYKIKEKPFKLLPDPEFIFLSQGHENCYAHLKYSIIENKGFVVITGEIGSGKTTLINYFLKQIKKKLSIGLINSTNLSPTQFIKAMCNEFELNVSRRSKLECHQMFFEFLLKQNKRGNRVALIIDEAQNLSISTLEEIRMISNYETEKKHLIQIILIGQPQLRKKINQTDLEQLAQRISVYFHLKGLEKKEVNDYIIHRLKIAGARNLEIFTQNAIETICEYSRCNPRTINVICDAALIYGFAESSKIIDSTIIKKCIKDREKAELFLYLDRKQTSMDSQNRIEDYREINKKLNSIGAKLTDIEKLLKS